MILTWTFIKRLQKDFDIIWVHTSTLEKELATNSGWILHVDKSRADVWSIAAIVGALSAFATEIVQINMLAFATSNHYSNLVSRLEYSTIFFVKLWTVDVRTRPPWLNTKHISMQNLPRRWRTWQQKSAFKAYVKKF